MPVTYDEFCPHCHKFEVAGKAIKPSCKSCKSVWPKVSDYWMDLDSWEATHKMKITDFRVRTQTDPKGYVEHGLEKDLNVLMATVKVDLAAEIAHKILEVMEDGRTTDTPMGILNKVAMNLGFIVADASKELLAAKKEAESE
jgi:hypothetical protein